MSAGPTEKTLSVDIGFTYVLILEWLDDDDEKTGTLLYNYLKQLDIPAFLFCAIQRRISVRRLSAQRGVFPPMATPSYTLSPTARHQKQTLGCPLVRGTEWHSNGPI